MSPTALAIRVRQGPQRVELRRFTTGLESIVTALRDIDSLASSKAEQATWIVDDIGRKDDFLTVTVSVRMDRNLHRTAESMLLPITVLVDGVRSLSGDSSIPPYYSEATIARLLKASERRRGVDDVSVATVNGKVGPYVGLSGAFRLNAAESVREFESALSSVTGSLNLIAKTPRKNRIRLSIVDGTSQRAVSGDAPASMADRLRDLWGHRVLLDGRVVRNRHGQPVRITVHDIEALPEYGSERADVDELLGIAPDWTGGVPVDEYVRSLRRG